ncbi:Isochorismatase family [Novymonas esmeraldas]|uniref:Isochorismatase family n=1 Tax=Novymonas esmeraldas TaxID=1808958 RepID=A0AAW0FBK6_9TRYP
MMLSEHSRLVQKFDTCRTAFMLCDVQEKVEPHISNFHDAVHVANAMAAIHEILGPERSVFAVTEQYPRGVGHVHPAIRLPADAIIAEKVQSSMLVPTLRPHILGDAERGIAPVQQVFLWGHETHGCVLQTADELLTHGIRVAILVDGCAAQLPEMHDVAVLQMAHWDGLMLTTTISAVMQLTRSDPRHVKSVLNTLKQFVSDSEATREPAATVAHGDATATFDSRPAVALDAPSAWCGMDH